MLDSENVNPALCLIYYDIIVPTVSIMSFITMLPAFYKFLKSKKVQKQYLFWAGAIFFVIIFFTIIINIFYSVHVCRNYEMYTIFVNIFTLSYTFQTCLLLGLSFARLHFAFHGTLFALSTLTIKLHLIYYSLSMIVLIVSAIIYSNFPHTNTGLLMVITGCAFLMLIIALIILTALFAYKTLQVYKHADKDPKLIEIITKLSVLAFIPLFGTLLDALAVVALIESASIHIQLLVALFAIFDLSTNFWCIILSYSEYNGWYLKLCGRCNSECKACWYNIAEKESKHTIKVQNT